MEKGQAFLSVHLVSQSLDADDPWKKAKSWVRQLSAVRQSPMTLTVEDHLQTVLPAAGGVNASFLKRDQHIMAFTTVEFPKSLPSREWCITEIGTGTAK